MAINDREINDIYYFFLCAGVSLVVSDHLIGQSIALERYSGGALHYFAQKGKLLGFFYFFFCVGVSSIFSVHLIGQAIALERYSGVATHYFTQKGKLLGFYYFFFCV